MNEILTTPGQKRARLIDKGLTEQDPEVAQLDKSERKRLKKEEAQAVEEYNKALTQKVTEVNVSNRILTCIDVLCSFT
jgi:hypothetical protein